MSALNTSTEYFFLNQVSLIYSQHNADYCIISLSLVHNILMFIVKHMQQFKGLSRRKFHSRSKKTELKVCMIVVKTRIKKKTINYTKCVSLYRQQSSL